jgi:hypothetical protein
MTKLEAELKRLEAEYNMFFAGRLPRLPWETRARVDALIKQYDRQHIPNTAQKFRFGTLQSRYAAFCDLWERALKAREEGRPHRGARGGGAAAPPAPAMPAAASGAERAAQKEPKEPRPRVVAAAAIKDPAKDADRLKELYEQLSSARQKAGEKPLPFDSFAKVVRAQVNKLGGGASGVAFKVAVEGGKVTLTAKKDGD